MKYDAKFYENKNLILSCELQKGKRVFCLVRNTKKGPKSLLRFPESTTRASKEDLETSSSWNEVTENYLVWVDEVIFWKWGFVPKYTLDESVYKYVVACNGRLLGEIPEESRTEGVCDAALEETGYAIKYVPEKYHTRERLERAVGGYDYHYNVPTGWAILDIPAEARTKELWMGAARNAVCKQFPNCDHPVLHMEVPDIEVLKEALRWKNFDILWAVQSHPEYAGMVDELLDYAVTISNFALDSMSYENRTPSRCEKAVRAFGLALEYVPEPLRTEKVCRLALENSNNDNACYGHDAAADVEEFIPWDILRRLNAEGVMPKKKNAWDHSA